MDNLSFEPIRPKITGNLRVIVRNKKTGEIKHVETMEVKTE